MKLLYTKRSPYARKVRVLALEKKIKLDLIEEDLANKSPRLLTASPLGKIPILLLDNKTTLCDSPVICQYLDGLKKSPVLIPRDKNKRLRVLYLEAIADGMMDAAVAAYMERARHPENYSTEFIRKQEETILRCAGWFNEQLKDLEKLSLAPIAAASAIGYACFRLPHLAVQDRFNKLGQWFLEFSQRPSMEQTRPG